MEISNIVNHSATALVKEYLTTEEKNMFMREKIKAYKKSWHQKVDNSENMCNFVPTVLATLLVRSAHLGGSFYL